jgi:very-short-patch-repair endonuclease
MTMWTEEQKKNMCGENNSATKYLKGKTYEEIYGVKKAKEQRKKRKWHYDYLRQSATINLKGRTYEDIYGPEKAKEQKEKRRMKTQQKYDNGTATFGFPTDGTMKIKRREQVFPIEDTRIEKKIHGFLEELEIEFFTHQYMHIEHGYQCDIYIPSIKTVIECDGDYWHGNPLRNKELNEKQKAQRIKDKLRTKELIEKGFKVIRLWENEINQLDLEEFKKICYETTK